MPLTVLIDAGRWLPVPPPGYGGIENMLATLRCWPARVRVLENLLVGTKGGRR